ncbi:ABC transporter ATP-binding protein [Candidatus Enterococcus clewellii]|uniref:ABC transporter domain-containing protein n=1 Tax=Candidatus Enterococcus clewellii TaxID=1834193 RepID=A0A242K6L9_9ENTE|nr:ABC transporter ATP-binding protein [Enterococcus sp. 9E7_DIV0242]OTP15962.1 hypothetical protein A5888_002176 [Enterococcus sp. 9E7_DIV0242]
MVLRINDLVKHYNDGSTIVKAVDHTSLEVKKGEFVAIIGKSGSGKSTLLNLVGGLDRPDSGEIYIDGKNVFEMKDEELAVFRRQKIGFIFQSYNLIPSLNVWENVVLPIGLDNRKVDVDFIDDLLQKIGIKEKKKTLPGMLSGGQQQRVAIARAIASRPAIILADEPTGNLDTKTELEVMSLLKHSVEQFGQTLIMITHDEAIAQMADRVIRIEDGRVS